MLQSETKNNQQVVANTGVTANMKFIGENSHSFDGKTIVEGSGTGAKVYQYVGGGSLADITTPTPSTATDWQEVVVSMVQSMLILVITLQIKHKQNMPNSLVVMQIQDLTLIIQQWHWI